jgi:hypothetical protein
MKILNTGITWKSKLVNCPPGAILSHRELPLGIGPSYDIDRVVRVTLWYILCVHGNTATSRGLGLRISSRIIISILIRSVALGCPDLESCSQLLKLALTTVIYVKEYPIVNNISHHSIEVEGVFNC